MSASTDTDLEFVCFNSSGLFCFADPVRIEQGREQGFVRADAQVQFAQGPGDYVLTVYQEGTGAWDGCVSKVEIRPATGLARSGAWRLAGTVPVDTGTIVAFDPETVLDNDLSYDDLFPDAACELPENAATMFSFATGVGDGRYQVMCDDTDAATLVSITFLAEEDEDEEDEENDGDRFADDEDDEL